MNVFQASWYPRICSGTTSMISGHFVTSRAASRTALMSWKYGAVFFMGFD
jgi:hypothetical protein